MGTQSWTAIDEAHLQALQQRKQVAEAATLAPLQQLVSQFCPASMSRDVVGWLIVHAEEMRDALQPFDSGVRQG